MKSDRPKMLQPLGGRPMLTHLLDTVQALAPGGVHVVIGAGAEAVQAACDGYRVNWVHQEERLGTGHAVMQALPAVPDGAPVLVLLGDAPLIPGTLLAEMVESYRGPLALLTMELEDPHGYGRILRDPGGNIIGVVEHGDAEPHQHAIREVNTGIIMADSEKLRAWLGRIGNDNAKGEYYLPDVFPLARALDGEIQGVRAEHAEDLAGANDRGQLAALERRYQRAWATACRGYGARGCGIGAWRPARGCCPTACWKAYGPRAPATSAPSPAYGRAPSCPRAAGSAISSKPRTRGWVRTARPAT